MEHISDHAVLIADVAKEIAEHCSNISVCLIQAENDEFGRHAYLNSLKDEENKQFQKKFRDFAGKYALPERKKTKAGVAV